MRLLVLFSLLLAATVSCGDPSPWGSFESPRYVNLTQKHLDLLQTGSPEFKPFTVALVADPQVIVSELKDCRTEINRHDEVAFSLLLGDLTDRSLRREFEWVAEIIQDFRRPILTVVGNHDGLIYGSSIYQKMFGPLNYSFIYNDVKFIMWNNNTYEWGYPDFAWLKSEIESHPRVVIVAHQPPGTVDRYEEVNTIWAELYRHPHVLGSVHGHMHNWNYQEIHDKPVVTVSQVKHTSWALMTVAEDGLHFQACKGSVCTAYP